MDFDTAAFAQGFDQGWADTSFHDPTYDQLDLSSPELSCGSLTTGTLTPQSSVSATTSRRHSLVSSVSKPPPLFSPIAACTKQSGIQQVPVAYEDTFRGFGGSSGIFGLMPSAPAIDPAFQMGFAEPNYSNKLHAMDLGQSNGMESSSSYASYNPQDLFSPRSSLGSDPGIAAAAAAAPSMQDQYSDYGRERPSYQPFPSIAPLYSLDERQYLETPQTVVPSQTTYTLPKTPPPTLAGPFVSPAKNSFIASPANDDADLSNQADRSPYPGLKPESPTSQVTCTSDEQPSVFRKLKSEDRDEESHGSSRSPLDRTVWQSEDEKQPATMLQYDGKGDTKRRSLNQCLKKAQRQQQIPGTSIKIEPGPQNQCKHCWPKKKKFRRPEHLQRHINCCHGFGTWHDCPVPKCGRSFYNRVDNLKAHIKNTHLYEGGPSKTKRGYISMEKAKELGLEDIDPRTPSNKAKSAKKEAQES